MMRKIGIYAGTFDPIHAGHIAFAKKTLETCGLDEVIFLPEKSPRGKSKVTKLDDRTKTIQKELLRYENMSVFISRSEQFTVAETLGEIDENFPGSIFALLIGSDVVLGLDHWPGIDKLVSQYSLAIGMRDRDSVRDVEHSLIALEKSTRLNITYRLIETDQSHVASSQLR